MYGYLDNISRSLLAALCVGLIVYYINKWWQDPLRHIPGPRSLPIIGNVLSIDVQRMHLQFYQMAQEYGDVMKIYLFHNPVVIINSTEACLEALIKRGTSFQGRVYLPRLNSVTKKNVVNLGYDDPIYVPLRKLATKAIKAYGPGITHLENTMQEVMCDLIDRIEGDQAQDIDELTSGFLGCVMIALMFGEKPDYKDADCQFLHDLNEEMIDAVDPFDNAAILDLFPFLFKFKFLFRSTHQKIEKLVQKLDHFFSQKISEAEQTFDPNNKRGCLDYFIEVQKEEVDDNGKPIFNYDCIQGILTDFVVAGIETSLTSLRQMFLDFLHDPLLQKSLQNQIDSQFAPNHIFTIQDRAKLPLLEAYVHENLRYLSQAPLLLPHLTIEDTEVAGYKIPKGTRVLINGFYTAHNPSVYDEPFEMKPERFLDENGNVVPPGHPLRYHFIGFGAGRRVCIGETLARSRIFLFLANILQKFSLEPVGKLPSRDVREYKMSVLIKPPSVSARFIRRQQ